MSAAVCRRSARRVRWTKRNDGVWRSASNRGLRAVGRPPRRPATHGKRRNARGLFGLCPVLVPPPPPSPCPGTRCLSAPSLPRGPDPRTTHVPGSQNEQHFNAAFISSCLSIGRRLMVQVNTSLCCLPARPLLAATVSGNVDADGLLHWCHSSSSPTRTMSRPHVTTSLALSKNCPATGYAVRSRVRGLLFARDCVHVLVLMPEVRRIPGTRSW